MKKKDTDVRICRCSVNREAFSFDGFSIAKEGCANGTREFYNPSVATEDQQHRRIETERERADGGQTFSKRRYTSGGCVRAWVGVLRSFPCFLWFFSVIRSEIVAGAEH